MTPLARAAWGFLVVVIDFRIDGFDVVADPLGWLLVLSGLVPLRSRSSWFMAAAVAAGVGALLSVPQLFAAATGALSAVQGVAEAAFVFGTCTGIMRLVEGPPRTTADRIRWIDLGVTAVGVLVGVAAGEATEVDGGGAALVLLLVLVGLAVVAWFTIFLLSVQRHPGLGAEPRVAP